MKKEKEKEASFDELWDAADAYVSISNEELKEQTIAKFKKNPNCIYLQEKDFDTLTSIDKTPYMDEDSLDLLECMTDTVNGEYLIFHNIYQYKGVTVYEIEDEDLYLLVNKEGTRYVFNVDDCSGLKGKHEQIFFTGYDYTTVYYIDKDIFEEI